jgi:MerR family transcriptional regulator, copper efflux regulator
MQETTYHIGEVASRVALSLRTVRYYESIGLVKPSGRTDGGFRLYTERDVQRLLLVRALKPTDLTPEELLELLDLRDRLIADQDSSVAGGAGRQARLHELLERGAQRIKLHRERLVAAELAVELIRATTPLDAPASAEP